MKIGVGYTPTVVVQAMVAQALDPWLRDRSPQEIAHLRILDLGCGQGAFFLGAYHYLRRWYGTTYLAQGERSRLEQDSQGQWHLAIALHPHLIRRHLYGIDLDSQAVVQTRQALTQAWNHSAVVPPTLRHQRTMAQVLCRQVRQGNALSPLQSRASGTEASFTWTTAFPEVIAAGGFTLILGNPPYVDADTMAHYLPHWRRSCQDYYRVARGNWDLFCVFCEQALELCQPGGLVSLIVPNKLATAPYAAPTRRLLTLDHQLLFLQDYSQTAVFAAGVYPLVYGVRKGPPPHPAPPVLCTTMALSPQGAIPLAPPTPFPYHPHFTRPPQPWPLGILPAQSHLVARLQEDHAHLGAIAPVWGAATVAEAYHIQPLIQDQATPAAEDLKMINSGTLDPYRSLWGIRPLRYLGQTYRHPIISRHHCGDLPPRRHHQARQAKLLVAGMGRILESFLDQDGTYLAGKSTVVILAPPSPCLPLELLLALLNSRLLTFCYQTLFQGDRLQGNYLRVGPPQLRQLPIWVPTPSPEHQALLAQILATTHTRLRAIATQAWETLPALDQTLNTLVEQAYRLNSAEQALVVQRVQHYPPKVPPTPHP